MSARRQTRCVEVKRRVWGGCEVVPVVSHGCQHCARAGGCQGAWFNRLLPIGRGIVLPVDADPGERLFVTIDERALARASWAGYGLLLVGLLGGAGLLVALTAGVGTGWRDLAAISGAVSGLALARAVCRRLPQTSMEVQRAA